MSHSVFEIKEVYSVWQKKNVRTIVVNAHAKNVAQRSIVSAMSIAKPYNRIELVGGEYLEPLSISIPLEFVASEGEEPQIVSRSRAVTVTTSCKVYFENVSILSKSKQKDGEAVGVLDGEVFFQQCKLSSLIVGAQGFVSMEKCYIQKSPTGIGLCVRDEGSGILRGCTIHSHFHKCIEMSTTGTFLIENCSIYNKRRDGGDLFVAAGCGTAHPGKFSSCSRVTLSQSRLYISADNENPDAPKGVKGSPSNPTDKKAFFTSNSSSSPGVGRESYMVGDPCCIVITNGAAPTIKQNILLEGDIGILLYHAGHATLTKNTIQYQRRGGIVALLPKLPQPQSVNNFRFGSGENEDDSGFSGLKIMGNNLIDHCFIGIDIHTQTIPKLPINTDLAILESCTFSPYIGGVEPFSWLRLPEVASAKSPSTSSVASVAKGMNENEAITFPVHGNRVNACELQYQLRQLAAMTLQIFRWCLNKDFGKRHSNVSTRVSIVSNGNYFANQFLHALELDVNEVLGNNTYSSVSSMVEKISISSTIFSRCGLCAIRFGHLSYGSVENCKFDENFRHAIIVGSGACPIITGCSFVKSSHSAILVGGYANPLVIGNHMVDGEKNGIEVTTLGRGIYMANYIASCMESGILVNSESDPLICANMIKRNAGGGVTVNTNSSPTIYLNILSVNSNAQIHICSKSHPFIIRNSIQSGLGVGMLFTSSSTGLVRKNHVISNKIGIAVENGADPDVAHNIVEKNSDSGITVHHQGLGTFFMNDVIYNGTNVLIMEGGDCVMRANNIAKGVQGGIVVRQKGSGFIEKNQLRENGVANLIIVDWESQPVCTCNCITSSPGCGVIVAAGGEGYFTKNQIFENGYCGVYVLTEANPDFFDNFISREAVGILVSESGQGSFQKNSINHIYGIGCIVQRKGAPVIQENQFSTCDLCAIQVGMESSGVVERNNITQSFFGLQIGSSFLTDELHIASAYFSPQMESATVSPRTYHTSGYNDGEDPRRTEVRQRKQSLPSPPTPPIMILQNEITENHAAGVLLQSTVKCLLEKNKIYKNKFFGILGDATYWERQNEEEEGNTDLKLIGGSTRLALSFLKLNNKKVICPPSNTVQFVKNRIYQHAFANIYFSYFLERGVKLVENVIFDSLAGIAILHNSLVEEATGNIIHHCVDGVQVMKGGKGRFLGNHIVHCSKVGLYISENGSPDFRSGNRIEYCRLCGVLCDVGASGDLRQSTIRQCAVGVWVLCPLDTPFQTQKFADNEMGPFPMGIPDSLSSSAPWVTTSVIEENLITEHFLHGVVLLGTRDQQGLHPIPECAIPVCTAWKDMKKETKQLSSSATSSTAPSSKFRSRNTTSVSDSKFFSPSSPNATNARKNSKFSRNVVKNNRICGFYIDRIDPGDIDPSLKLPFSMQEKSTRATSDAILGASLLGTTREHLDDRAKQQPYLMENQVEGCTIGVSVGAWCHPLIERNSIRNNLFFGLVLRQHSAAMIYGCHIVDNGLAGVYVCKSSKGTLCDSLISHNADSRLLKCAERDGEGSTDFFVPTTTLSTVLVTLEDELKKEEGKYQKGLSDNQGKNLFMRVPQVEEKEQDKFLFFPQESSTSKTFQSKGYRWLAEAANFSGTQSGASGIERDTMDETISPTGLSEDFPSKAASFMVLPKWLLMQCRVMACLTGLLCEMILAAGSASHNIFPASSVIPPRDLIGENMVGEDEARCERHGLLSSNHPAPRKVNLLQGGVGVWAEQGSRTTLRHNGISEHHQVGLFVGTGMQHVFSQLQERLAQKNANATPGMWWIHTGTTTGHGKEKKKLCAAEPSPEETARKVLTEWNTAIAEDSDGQNLDVGWALLLFFCTGSSSFLGVDWTTIQLGSSSDASPDQMNMFPSVGELQEPSALQGIKSQPSGSADAPSTLDPLQRAGSFRKGGGGSKRQYSAEEGNFRHCIIIEKNQVTRNTEGIHVQVLHSIRAIAKDRPPNLNASTFPGRSPSCKEAGNELRKTNSAGRLFPSHSSSGFTSKKEGKSGIVNTFSGKEDSTQYTQEAVVMVRENQVFENVKVGVYAEHVVEVDCYDLFDSSDSLWSMVLSACEDGNIVADLEASASRFSLHEPPFVDARDFPFVLPALSPSSRRSAVICQNDFYGNRQLQAEVTSQYIVVGKDQAKTLVEMNTFCDPATARNKFASSQVLYRVPFVAALFQRSLPGSIHVHNNHFHDAIYGLRCFGVLWSDSVRIYRNQFSHFQQEAVAVLGHLSSATIGPENVFFDNQIAVQIHVHVPKKDEMTCNVNDFETRIFKCVFTAQRQQSIRILGVGGTPAVVEFNTFTGHGEGSVAMLLITPSIASASSIARGAVSHAAVEVLGNKFTYNYLPVVVMGEELTRSSGPSSRESLSNPTAPVPKEEKDGEKGSNNTVNNSVGNLLRSPMRPSVSFFPSGEKPKLMSGQLIIARNEFSFNVIGALICNGATLRLVQNLFVKNSRAGLEITGLLTSPVIEECVFQHNSNLHPLAKEELSEKSEMQEEKAKSLLHRTPLSGRLGHNLKAVRESFSMESPTSPLSMQGSCSTRYRWKEDQTEVVIRGVPLPVSIAPIHQYALGDTHGKHTLSSGILLNPGSQCTVNRCLFDQNDVGVDTVRCMLVSKDEKLALFTHSVFQNHHVAGVMVRFCETARIRESAALLPRGSFPKETTRFESNFFVDNTFDTEKGIGDVVGKEFGSAVFRGNLFCGMVHGMENGYFWLDSNYFLPESTNGKSADSAIVLHHETKVMATKNIIGKRKVGVESQEDALGFISENIIMQCTIGIRSLYLSKTRFSKNRILGSSSAAMVVYSGEFDENDIVFSKDGILVKDVANTKATHVITVSRRNEGKAKIHRNRLYACEKEGIVVGTPSEIIGNMIQDSNVGIHLIPFHTKVDKEQEDEWNLVRSNFVLMNYIGLLVEEKSMTAIKDNDIFDNTSVGVSVEENACGVLHGNRISSVKDEDAVVIATSAKLRVANNTIRHRFSPVFNRVPHNCRHKEMGAFMQSVVEEMEEYNKGWEEMVSQERNLEQSLLKIDISSHLEAPSPRLLLDIPSPHSLDYELSSSVYSPLSNDFFSGAPTLELRRRKESVSLGAAMITSLSVGSPAQFSGISFSSASTFSNNNNNNFPNTFLQDGNRDANEKHHPSDAAPLEPHTPPVSRGKQAPPSSLSFSNSRNISGSASVCSKNIDRSSIDNSKTISNSNAPSGSLHLHRHSDTISTDESRHSTSKAGSTSDKLHLARPSLSNPSLSGSSLSVVSAFKGHRSSTVKDGDWKAPRRFVPPNTPSTGKTSFSGTLTGGTAPNTLVSRARESAIYTAQVARQKEADRLQKETTPLLLHILTRSSGQKEAQAWGNALAKILTKPPLDKIHFRVFVSISKEDLYYTMEENSPEVILLLAHPSCCGPSSPIERDVLSLLHNAATNGGKGLGGGNTIPVPPSPSAKKTGSTPPAISPRQHRLSSSAIMPKFMLALFSEKQIEEDSAFSTDGIHSSIASLLEGPLGGSGVSNTPMSLSTFSAAHRTLMYSNSVEELHGEVVYILQNECQAKKKSPRGTGVPFLSPSAFSFASSPTSPFASTLAEENYSISPTGTTPTKNAVGISGEPRRKTIIDGRPSIAEARQFTLEDVAQLMSLIDPKSTVDPKEERRKKRKKKKEERQTTLSKHNYGNENENEDNENDDGEAPNNNNDDDNDDTAGMLADSLSISKELDSSSIFDSTIRSKKKVKKVKSRPLNGFSAPRKKTLVSNALAQTESRRGEARKESLQRSFSIISSELSKTTLDPLGESKK